MGRWEPNARGRLEEAALDLYRERGFDRTTVAEIAARAGLTERTFFRYFADKREVLFSGAEALRERLIQAVGALPPEASAMQAVAAGMEAVASHIQRRDHARRRQQVILENPELLERERVKLADLAAALGEALRRRGVAEPGATLAAETGSAVFRVAFERWIGEREERDLASAVREAFDALRTVVVGA